MIRVLISLALHRVGIHSRIVTRCAGVVCIAGLSLAADKDARVTIKAAGDYPSHVTQEKVTIAAVPYVSEEDLRIFGKKSPLQYGVLPVLVVIQNDTGKTLRLDPQAEYIDGRGRHVEAVPASDVQFVGAVPKRHDTNIGMKSPIPLPKKKSGGPLSGGDFEGKGFAAKMIPAGERASGFFYFEAHLDPGAKLYLNGIKEAGSGKELFYFEIPLTKD